MSRARLTFWYDLASTYAYLSAMRIGSPAEAAGVEITWQPFLLGPLFRAQGWETSPFNVYPAKGRYMVRDVGRIAALRGLPFAMPNAFPAHSVRAARLVLTFEDMAERQTLTQALFRAEFDGGDFDLSNPDDLRRVLVETGLDASAIDRLEDPRIKSALRDATDRAARLGIFGAPTFVADDDELFWGDDRLDLAIAHARRISDTRAAIG